MNIKTILKTIFKALGITLGILVVTLFLLVTILYFRADYIPKTSLQEFLKTTTKKPKKETETPLSLWLGELMLTDEIDSFDDAPQDVKDKWDKIAKRAQEVEEKLNRTMKQLMETPEAQALEKLSSQIEKKHKQVIEEIKKDEEIQKIDVQIEELNQKLKPLQQQMDTLYKTKFTHLIEKKHLILYGKRGSFKNYLLSSLPIFLSDIVTNFYKHTTAYTTLAQQTQEFENEQEKINKAKQPYTKEISRLKALQMERIDVFAKASETLRNLHEEIEALSKKFDEKNKLYSEQKEKGRTKYEDLAEESGKLRRKLHKIFDEIIVE